MPIIIAALVYGALAALILTVVMVIGLARGRQPGRAVLAGAVGSLAGFLLGCAAAVLVGVAGPNVRVAATALVVPASLVSAVLGAVVGVAIARRAWSRWSPPKGLRHTEPGASADRGRM
jgi:ascorbate-specific PTS system EIIC-type component UlaA